VVHFSLFQAPNRAHTIMHIQGVLQNLGYRPNEATVYLAALQLGACSVHELVDKTGLPRTTVQEIIASLKKNGLINPITRKNHKYWIAENPNKLMITLKEQEAALSSVLPELQALRYDTGVKPAVRTFSGKKEMVKIMDDIIETRSHILAIVSWDEWVNLLGKDYLDDFIEKRRNHFLNIRLISPRTQLARSLKIKDTKDLRITRFLPDTIEVNNSNFIYGNKIAILSLNKRYPVGIIIEDEDINHTMTVLFELLWNKSGTQ